MLRRAVTFCINGTMLPSSDKVVLYKNMLQYAVTFCASTKKCTQKIKLIDPVVWWHSMSKVTYGDMGEGRLSVMSSLLDFTPQPYPCWRGIIDAQGICPSVILGGWLFSFAQASILWFCADIFPKRVGVQFSWFEIPF